MSLNLNRLQWVTVWLGTLMTLAAIGKFDKRGAVAYILATVVMALFQGKSKARGFWRIAGQVILTVVVLLAAVVLSHPK